MLLVIIDMVHMSLTQIVGQLGALRDGTVLHPAHNKPLSMLRDVHVPGAVQLPLQRVRTGRQTTQAGCARKYVVIGGISRVDPAPATQKVLAHHGDK